MRKEKSFVNAISKAKRDGLAEKYSPVENLLNVIYGYYLRVEDEVPELVKAYNRFAEKNHLETVTLEMVIRNI